MVHRDSANRVAQDITDRFNEICIVVLDHGRKGRAGVLWTMERLLENERKV